MPRRLLLPILILLGGCYGYYPLTAAAPVGRDVELTLSDSGAVALARTIGPSASSMLGRVVADSTNSVVLSLSAVRQRDGNEVEWKGEHVAVPRLLMSGLAERRFSRGRTAVFSTAVAIALVALREGFAGGGFGSLGSGKPGSGSSK